MTRHKQGFWLLLLVFSLIIMAAVLSPPSPGEIVPEKADTMGFMMKKEHAEGLTLADLYRLSASGESETMAGHGHQPPLFLKTISLFSTTLMLFLFPLIIGAAVVMIILWI